MSSRYLVVVDDPTTAGGKSLEGHGLFAIQCTDGMRRNIVRIGDPVLCGQCGPTAVIEGVDYVFVNGPKVAYDGCALACGHKLVSTLQRLVSVKIDSSIGSSASKSRTMFTKEPSVPAGMFTEQYRAVAQGQPIAGIPYRIDVEDGSTYSGKTDERGMTIKVLTNSPEQVRLTWLDVWQDDIENDGATTEGC